MLKEEKGLQRAVAMENFYANLKPHYFDRTRRNLQMPTVRRLCEGMSGEQIFRLATRIKRKGVGYSMWEKWGVADCRDERGYWAEWSKSAHEVQQVVRIDHNT